MLKYLYLFELTVKICMGQKIVFFVRNMSINFENIWDAASDMFYDGVLQISK
jgi:hypothetical protein